MYSNNNIYTESRAVITTEAVGNNNNNNVYRLG